MEGSRFTSYNPSTGKPIWTGEAASAADIHSAIQKARAAFPAWKATSLQDRMALLERFADVVRKNSIELATAISEETGKPLWDSKGEVNAVINKVGLSIVAYQERCPSQQVAHPLGFSLTRHRPFGVMAVLGPFNFPAHLPQGHIIPALLAGNTIVFKPSDHTPRVGELLIKYWDEAGLPEGVFNCIQGKAETGRLLSQHPGIDGLCFTGSWPVGKLLAEFFAKTPYKILALEMGGNNPLVVGQIDNPLAAAYITIQSAYLSAGQRCTCARRLILVDGPTSGPYLQALISLTQGLSVGPYNQHPEPFMGPVINEAQALKIISAEKELVASGGVALVAAQHLKTGTGLITPGLIDVTHVPELKDEEIFGPFLQLIRVPDLQKAIELANKTAYGLSSGILTALTEEYEQFLGQSHAGIINWNAPLTGASSAAPFGGQGQSGNNRPSAYYAADYCAYPVVSVEAPELKLPDILHPGVSLKS